MGLLGDTSEVWPSIFEAGRFPGPRDGLALQNEVRPLPLGALNMQL